MYRQNLADEPAAVEMPPGVGAVGELEKCGPVAADKYIRIAALRVESGPRTAPVAISIATTWPSFSPHTTAPIGPAKSSPAERTGAGEGQLGAPEVRS